jgi:hypothetical protein
MATDAAETEPVPLGEPATPAAGTVRPRLGGSALKRPPREPLPPVEAHQDEIVLDWGGLVMDTVYRTQTIQWSVHPGRAGANGEWRALAKRTGRNCRPFASRGASIGRLGAFARSAASAAQGQRRTRHAQQ